MRTIKLNRITLVNFLSYKKQIHNFREGVTLVRGEIENNPALSNGAGKTALAEGIFWCLFGKSLRDITLDELVNAQAGEGCEVHLLLEDDNGEFQVSRYRRHPDFANKLVVAVGGRTVTDGAEEILRQLVPISEAMFANSVMFGRSSRLVLFTRMPDGEKKELIRQVCPQLTKLEDIHNRVKKEHDKLRTNIAANTSTLDYANASAESLQKAMNEAGGFLKNRREACKEELADLKAKRLKLNAERGSLGKTIKFLTDKCKSPERDKIKEQQTQHQLRLDATRQAHTRISANMEHFKKQIEMFNNQKVCPTCKRPYDNDPSIDQHILKLNEEHDKLKVSRQEQQNELDSLTLKLTNLKKKEKQLEEENKMFFDQLQVAQRNFSIVSNDCIRVKNEIQKLKDDIDKYVSIYKMKKQQYTAELDRINTLTGLLEEQKNSLIIKELLVRATGNSGLPAYIVDGFLSKLEHYTNTILSNMAGCDISVTITSGKSAEKGSREGRISITADRRGGGMTFGSTSSGESARVDIAIMLALSLAIQDWSGIDFQFMFLDEIIDLALDEQGAAEVVDMLQTSIAPAKKKVYLTSHRPDIKNRELESITVSKRDNVSTIKGV